MLRRRRQDERPAGVDPAEAARHQQAVWAAGLPPRWRSTVEEAIAARARFLALLAQTPSGPTRERLTGLVATMDEAVRRVAETVWRAMRAAELAGGLGAERANAELKEARRHLDAVRRSGADTTAAHERVEALAERHRAVTDALNLAEDAGSRLGELTVRLDTAVARATTVVLRATTEDTDQLEREFDEVVVGLTALDDALGGFA